MKNCDFKPELRKIVREENFENLSEMLCGNRIYLRENMNYELFYEKNKNFCYSKDL